ncbi:MAG TPA: class I SAM-dependent methyltransferase [Bosea sp. (in: a-proteobacteria)]|uniref:class I SAM-dependent methyltransferase n=1 Tax=Bosea sp. (in: a-proteobacteria) TaxID=1871050 RepID=UPI002E156BA1|nr:class I SAM-dependent methyltransferase [Bosea sp. (in: a-proteobacteria)]
MQIRTRLPDVIRRTYRLARSLGPVDAIQAIPADLLDDCRFCGSREAMLSLLPQAGVVAELGTYRGDFARSIMRLNQPSALHLIDIDYSHFISEGLDDPAITRHVGYTHETIAAFPDGHFDWVYIDADHSYAGCLRDAQAAAAKVKPGGYLAFNDFAHIDPWLGRYGVQRAAAEFAVTHRWPMAFFCYQPAGLYDVAFRRPAA